MFIMVNNMEENCSQLDTLQTEDTCAEVLDNTTSEEEEVNNKLEMYMSLAKENERKYMYARADLENVKKQSAIKVAKAGDDAINQYMKATLNILDDFERALLYEYNEGYSLIYNKLISLFKSNGLEEIETIGLKFDDNTMEAVSVIPCDEKEDNDVLETVLKGYKRGNTILRHAKVIVVKNS